MWGNFNLSNPISLNAPCDIHVKSTVSFAEHKSLDKFEKKSALESDTDFQSFLMPLEQDFTKSSKGYASLLTAIPNKEIKGVHRKNKQNESKISNILTEKYSETDYLKNINDKFLHNNSSCIGNNFKNNADNLYCKKYAKFFCETLQNNEGNQNGENIFSKDSKAITLDTLRNSLEDNNVSKSDKNIIFSEEPLKTVSNYSVSFPNSVTFKDKSDDDDNSKLSETDSSYSVCSNSLSFDDSSNTNDNEIVSEKVFKMKNENFDESESSDADDCLKESEVKASAIFSENSTFEYKAVNPLENSVTSQKNFCDSIISFSSQGYINACFEDDDDDDILFENSSFLKSINESWDDSMKNISGEPHEPKRVSFVPLPNLVSVYSYESEDDNYRYSLYVLDQLRFQGRIKDFEFIIAPYLTSEHRANIYQRYFL